MGDSLRASGGAAVLVLAPFARDTAVTCDFLKNAGIEASSCADIGELCEALGAAAGAVLAMEEALAGDSLTRLAAALEAQPAWSDIPVLVLVGSHHKTDSADVRRLSEAGANVTLLARPIHPVTLLSCVRSSLRARARQYRLRDALAPQEESYRPLVEMDPRATIIHLDGRVVYANPAAAALVGAPDAKALVGRPVTKWIHPDFAGVTEKRLAALAAGGAAPQRVVQRWVRADGGDVEVEADFAPLRWRDRAAARITAQEVTGRRGAEQRLAALKHVRVTLFQQDRELRYTWIHDAFVDRPSAQVIGRRDADLLPQREEAEALEAFKREVMASGRGAHRRFRLSSSDGARHFEIRAEPLRDDRGKVDGVAGAAVDITEHVELAEQLRQQPEPQAPADRRDDAFLAQLAHELRNPLAPIHNAVHVLRIQPDPPDPAHVKWATEVIGRQVRHLARLVDDLFDVGRIAHGGITLRLETVELGRVLTQAIEAVRPLTTGRKQILTYSPPVEPLQVRADVTRLMQVVGNLLNNAARYTPPRGRIALSVQREDDRALVRVKDDGIGIPPDAMQRIFEPFQQGPRPPDTAPLGLGLGLALVQHLVTLHEGSVEAYSEGPGKGSEFVVRLPLAPSVREGPPAGPQESNARRMLVVDDDRDVAQSFALLLGLMGYQVRAANDGADALKAAEAFRPHIVFVDIGLPDMDGYELARALRSTNPDPAMRLVALTGYSQEEVRQRTAAAGFDAHLLKPVGVETMERLLDSFRSRG